MNHNVQDFKENHFDYWIQWRRVRYLKVFHEKREMHGRCENVLTRKYLLVSLQGNNSKRRKEIPGDKLERPAHCQPLPWTTWEGDLKITACSFTAQFTWPNVSERAFKNSWQLSAFKVRAKNRIRLSYSWEKNRRKNRKTTGHLPWAVDVPGLHKI